jgi:hypothetical protein
MKKENASERVVVANDGAPIKVPARKSVIGGTIIKTPPKPSVTPKKK